MHLDTNDIQKIILHRYPFLMIDRVIECIPGEKLIAVKNASINEAHFLGHFPSEPVMLGVLMIEAIAQAGCVFYHISRQLQKPVIYYLAKSEAKFHKPVVPGDVLTIVVTPVKIMGKVGFIQGCVTVDGVCAVEAQIGFAIKENAA